jgi:cytochrome c-type biogenesis protein
MNEISIGLAFIAGLASFLSPCVFSLIPAYVGYLGGRTAISSDPQAATPQSKTWVTFTHGLAFVIGFSLVFILLGGVFAYLGSALYAVKTWLPKIGGLIVVLFGMQMTGLIRIPFLEMDLHPQTSQQNKLSYTSSFLMGIFFSAGWSPCLGPVLSSILTLAVNQGSISQGIILLTAYSTGLAIPFLAASLGIGWVLWILRKYGRVMRITEIVMGVLLIIVGVMLMTGSYQIFAQMGNIFDFGL